MLALSRSLASCAVLALVTAAACSSASAKKIDAADYDSSCLVDADCTPATFGDACELACNPNGAINRREQGRYDSDLASKNKDCPVVNYVRDPCEGSRRPYEARCSVSRCTLLEIVDAGADATAPQDAGAGG